MSKEILNVEPSTLPTDLVFYQLKFEIHQKLKLVLPLFLFSFLFLFLISSQTAYAFDDGFFWDSGGYAIDESPAGSNLTNFFEIYDTNLDGNGNPSDQLIVTVESKNTSGSSIETLNLILTESLDDGIFGIDHMVFMVEELEFKITDTILITSLHESYQIYSDSDHLGIALDLIETGPDTGIFTGLFSFSTIESDEANAVLHASQGDRFTVEDLETGLLTNGLISGRSDRFALLVEVNGTVEVTATPSSGAIPITDTITINQGGTGGSGSGGLVRPGLVVDSPSNSEGGLDSNGSGNGGDNQWDTRPTFGISHEDRQNQVVENGFSFNSEYFTLTDNHHTDFAEQSVDIGTVNSFSATVYADKKLKIQEFLFGIPSVGEAHLAELGVEVWYDNNGEIEDVKVVQNSDVIDVDTVSVTHEKVKCIPTDAEARCDTTTVSMIFLEPLIDKVMAVKAVDYALRDQRTYLNEGFDISGESLNPMLSNMIPSTIKNEGLLKVTQVEKYSPYWTADDGRMFEMNNFGSFKQINQSFERFQDTGNAFTRMHSGFGGIIAYEQKRALEVFDSSEFISNLPESFAYIFPETGQRITDEIKQEMILQEQIAKEILDAIVKPQRNY